MVPILSGPRLKLRGFTWADFAPFAAMWQEPKMADYIPFAPISETNNWSRFNGNTARWANRGYGGWAVIEPGGKFAGTIGLFDCFGGYLGDTPVIESGWVFSAEFQGQGYASEAAGLAHGWLDAQPFGGRSICVMDARHRASIRVAEKTGYRFVKKSKDEYGEIQVMERIGAG